MTTPTSDPYRDRVFQMFCALVSRDGANPCYMEIAYKLVKDFDAGYPALTLGDAQKATAVK